MKNFLKKFIKISLILTVLFSLKSLEAVSQKNNELSLKQALEISYGNAPELVLARWDFEIAELAYRSAWETYYLPEVNIKGQTDSHFALAKVPGNQTSRYLDTGNKPLGYPESSVSFNIGKYTLFDGWASSGTFESSKYLWTNAQEKIKEAKINTTKNVTLAYYSAWNAQENIKAIQRSIRIATEVLLLLEAKKKLGQITEAQLESVRSDLNKEQSKLTDLRKEYLDTNKELKVILGDDLQSGYYALTTPIQFKPIRLSEKGITKIFLEKNPEIQSSHRALLESQRSFESAELSNMPIPKVELSGLSLTYGTNYYRSTWLPDSTESNGFFEVTTSVSVTFPFFGDAGFFNKRAIAKARIERDKSEFTHNNLLQKEVVAISNDISQIYLSQSSVKNSKERLESALKVLDSEVKKISSSRAKNFSRVDLRDAVREASDTEFEYRNNIFLHQSKIFELAIKLGIEDINELYSLSSYKDSAEE